MSAIAKLRCRCGQVSGTVTNASPNTVNRAVCYCSDCQSFAHHLKRPDLLDAHGGSDIVQVAPSTLSFDRGAAQIVGLRLSPKGLYRFYTACCQTPVGNTVNPTMPFVGMLAQAFESADDAFGKPTGGFNGKDAIGTPPPGTVKINVRLLLRSLRRILGWKLRGQSWPHPFFDRATKAPSRPVSVISREERAAARALSGPRPA